MILLACLVIGADSHKNLMSRQIIDLWPGAPPGKWKREDLEIVEKNKAENFLTVKNVSKPTLEIFKAVGAGKDTPTVIICPGGGYCIEAIEHEGWEIAKRLNHSHINAAVLKYRLPNRDTDHPLYLAPLQDAQRAIRLVRFHSSLWGLDSTRVGIMGFSAGGHLSVEVSTATHASYLPTDGADELSARPDFAALIYPAYLDDGGRAKLSPDVIVTPQTPPTFIVQTMDDPIHVEGAFAYALACKDEGVKVEMHIFPTGGHGYGLRTKVPGISSWPALLTDWIKRSFPF
jgi:acetyl esterase/lipase